MMMKENIEHIPVMLSEVLEYLNLKKGAVIIDATVGLGGHSKEILDRILPGGRLVCIDKDNESLKVSKENLHEHEKTIDFVYDDFRNLDKIADNLGIKKVDGILFDLGLSSFQFCSGDRGFSIKQDGPLDMRMDRNSYISAYDLVNNLTKDEISNILFSFGQERWHNRIASNLVRDRQHSPISTTSQLKDIVLKSVPYSGVNSRIHPATRTFQALRIAVNRELESLQEGLKKGFELLSAGSRIAVISFHSLEDRIAKNTFKAFASLERARIITKKPLVAQDSEISNNPRSRSAKLRVIERLS